MILLTWMTPLWVMILMILVHLAALYSPADNSNALIVLTFQAHHTAPRVSLHQQIMLNKNFKVHCVPITKEPLLALELFRAFGTHMGAQFGISVWVLRPANSLVFSLGT